MMATSDTRGRGGQVAVAILLCSMACLAPILVRMSGEEADLTWYYVARLAQIAMLGLLCLRVARGPAPRPSRVALAGGAMQTVAMGALALVIGHDVGAPSHVMAACVYGAGMALLVIGAVTHVASFGWRTTRWALPLSAAIGHALFLALDLLLPKGALHVPQALAAVAATALALAASSWRARAGQGADDEAGLPGTAGAAVSEGQGMRALIAAGMRDADRGSMALYMLCLVVISSLFGACSQAAGTVSGLFEPASTVVTIVGLGVIAILERHAGVRRSIATPTTVIVFVLFAGGLSLIPLTMEHGVPPVTRALVKVAFTCYYCLLWLHAIRRFDGRPRATVVVLAIISGSVIASAMAGRLTVSVAMHLSASTSAVLLAVVTAGTLLLTLSLGAVALAAMRHSAPMGAPRVPPGDAQAETRDGAPVASSDDDERARPDDDTRPTPTDETTRTAAALTALLAAIAEDRGLSARETEVIALYAHGRSATYIAAELDISPQTVKTHLKRAYAKLDVHSRQDLLDLLYDHSRGDGGACASPGREDAGGEDGRS
ncbi:helix-turn-helix transcriptional regulator [bacterium]|nr:helix-turn-helix transcriptional regulator [bacterium]